MYFSFLQYSNIVIYKGWRKNRTILDANLNVTSLVFCATLYFFSVNLLVVLGIGICDQFDRLCHVSPLVFAFSYNPQVSLHLSRSVPSTFSGLTWNFGACKHRFHVRLDRLKSLKLSNNKIQKFTVCQELNEDVLTPEEVGALIHT